MNNHSLAGDPFSDTTTGLRAVSEPLYWQSFELIGAASRTQIDPEEHVPAR